MSVSLLSGRKEVPVKLYSGVIGSTMSTPAFRAVSAVTTGAPTMSVTIPATAQVGDLALIVLGGGSFSGINTITVTGSTGWTTLFTGTSGSVTGGVTAKVLTAADIGTTVSVSYVSSGGSSTVAAACIVYSGADTSSPLTTAVSVTGFNYVTSSATDPLPALPSFPYANYMEIGYWTSYTAGSAITTPPSGMTQRAFSQAWPNFVLYEEVGGPGGQSLTLAASQTYFGSLLVLVGGGSTQLATPTTVLYTAPSKTRVKNIVLNNLGAASAKVSMNISGTPFLSSYSLSPGNGAVVISLDNLVLAAGDTIVANSGVLDSVNASINGAAVS